MIIDAVLFRFVLFHRCKNSLLTPVINAFSFRVAEFLRRVHKETRGNMAVRQLICWDRLPADQREKVMKELVRPSLEQASSDLWTVEPRAAPDESIEVFKVFCETSSSK